MLAWADLGTVGRVADLGCGLGFFGHLLLSRFPRARIDGFDLHEETVAEARRRAAAHRGRLTFSVGDVAHLDVRDGLYDLVTTQALLVHQSRPEAVLREARRILRPGGRVLLVEPDPRAAFDALDPAPAGIEDPWPRVVAGAELRGAGRWGTETELPRLPAGFEDVAVRRHPGRFTASEALRAHLMDRDEADEAAHVELLGSLHEAGGGDPAAWRAHARALAAGRARRRRDLRDGTFAVDRWGGLHVATARRV